MVNEASLPASLNGQVSGYDTRRLRLLALAGIVIAVYGEESPLSNSGETAPTTRDAPPNIVCWPGPPQGAAGALIDHQHLINAPAAMLVTTNASSDPTVGPNEQQGVSP